MKKLIIALLTFIAILVLWGVGIEPRLISISRYQVKIPDLPESWEGKTVAFVSDLQLGIWLDNESTVQRIIDRLVRDRPALVLLGGDFVYHPTGDEKSEAVEELEKEDFAEVREVIERVIGDLRPLADSGIPTFAVLGNHDYAMQNKDSYKLPWVAKQLSEALEAIGIPVLENSAVPLKGENDGSTLYLVGIGPHYPGGDDVKEAFASLPEMAPRIVLMHNPQSFARIPPGAAPLAVAGHTHGGQIRIPFLPTWSWISIVQEGEVHSEGWIENFGQGGNRLYVNRGIGFSHVPIRINCVPEVTYFTFVKATPEMAE